jgi:hypothetical protein
VLKASTTTTNQNALTRKRFSIRRKEFATILLGGVFETINLSADDATRVYHLRSNIIPTFSYRIINRDFVMSATITDGIGIANMQDNEIIDCPLGWDLNQDDDYVEIVNQEQRPVFQMIVTGDPGIAMLGGFWTGTKTATYVSPDGVFPFSPLSTTPYGLNRLFNYPSSQFPAGRVNPPSAKHEHRRTVERYITEICGLRGMDEFLLRCAQQNSANWDRRFEPVSIWKWIVADY